MSSVSTPGRPAVAGKWLIAGGKKLRVQGVTYGTFKESEAGPIPSRRRVAADFGEMAANGVNAVRIYTVPPSWLLDAAADHGLRVMVGLPWEQHVAFLDDRRRAAAIVDRVRAGVHACAGHPGLLSLSLGNEIPASIVRWHGRRAIERFIGRLFEAARAEDPAALLTYANYPSTEYLQLPFLDFVSFNVFLESDASFDRYIARLQNLAGDRPLVVTETGLDSLRHGDAAQARAVGSQITTAFTNGCAGVFTFAWTDEWHRGGVPVTDWAFGLIRRDRSPKPALAAAREAYVAAPAHTRPAPRISVVVCTHNGERTLAECLSGLRAVDYPDVEVLVVDDGSTDATPAIAQASGFRVITVPNGGLSAARNVGLREASGEIVAYLDDDAHPDPDWLTFLAATFASGQHAAAGGPNIPPVDECFTARAVASAPGGPIHVLVSDREAEHIPGCNMAFRRTDLETIGGFDPQFRVAGDDVDVCWRLQAAGGSIGFHPGAVVWHRRRDSVRGYLRQQYGYGRAEALLERKWPERYNRAGHLSWAGRVYANGRADTGNLRRWRVRYGRGGTGLFQSLYQRAPGTLSELPLAPEWYLIVLALAGLTALGALWSPLLLAGPVLVAAVGVPVLESAVVAARSFPVREVRQRRRLQCLTAVLHLLQPLARLFGRLSSGLAPWRRRSGSGLRVPLPRTRTSWHESWRSVDERLAEIEAVLRGRRASTLRGGDFDRWDVTVLGGALGASRMRLAVEEHGSGRQLVRVRSWPVPSRTGLIAATVLTMVGIAAALDGVAAVALALLGGAMVVIALVIADCAAAAGALSEMPPAERPDPHSRSAAEDRGPNLARAHDGDNGHIVTRQSAPHGTPDQRPLEIPSAMSVPPTRPGASSR